MLLRAARYSAICLRASLTICFERATSSNFSWWVSAFCLSQSLTCSIRCRNSQADKFVRSADTLRRGVDWVIAQYLSGEFAAPLGG
jgi:hypothetical protein